MGEGSLQGRITEVSEGSEADEQVRLGVAHDALDDALALGVAGLAEVRGEAVVGGEGDVVGRGHHGAGHDPARDTPKAVRERFLDPLEDVAKAPFDAVHDRDTGNAVRGLGGPSSHRGNSFGHDPLLGLLFGVGDFMHATGTYVDASGNVVRVATEKSHEHLVGAIGKEIAHLLSDFATPQGIQPPGFTLVQLLPGRSPFRLSGETRAILWIDVARTMYRRGYDLRHCFASGIVPGAVTAIIATTATAEAHLAARDVVAEKSPPCSSSGKPSGSRGPCSRRRVHRMNRGVETFTQNPRTCIGH